MVHKVHIITIATMFDEALGIVRTPINTAAIFRVPIPSDKTTFSLRLSPNPE